MHTHSRLVRDIMHPGVLTCDVSTPIRQVVQQLEGAQVHALVVVDAEGYLAGIISQTDLVHARVVKPDWAAWDDLPVERLMTPYAITVRPDEPEQQAIRKLTENNIHRLVVVEEEPEGRRKRPVGIVSMTDLVHEMAQ